jgi:hypothetical protein
VLRPESGSSAEADRMMPVAEPSWREPGCLQPERCSTIPERAKCGMSDRLKRADQVAGRHIKVDRTSTCTKP